MFLFKSNKRTKRETYNNNNLYHRNENSNSFCLGVEKICIEGQNIVILVS